MKKILNILLTTAVLFAAGCSSANETDGQIIINLKVTFMDEPVCNSYTAGKGLILVFDENGDTIGKHPVSGGAFYHGCTLTFVNLPASAYRVAAVYGEIYDFVNTKDLGSLENLMDAGEGFAAMSPSSFLGALLLPNSSVSRLTQATMEVVYLPDGSMMKEYINSLL